MPRMSKKRKQELSFFLNDRGRQGVGEPNRIYVLIPGKEDVALA